ncbi:MAG: LegC family aminotransferase [Candidatus Omnitrophica bacterium]|nr:LegC family aminotransferase [Candidatus Omnitrophota bacterium]
MTEKIIPLSVPSLKGNEFKYVKECIDTEWVSSAGSYVDKFAKEMASYAGTKYAIACSSGTAALHTALILTGVEAGDEVIVPDVTFIAPVNTVRYVGANPVFIDCDDYLNIDADKLASFCEEECDFTGEKLINKTSGARVRAIIPVHIFGNPAEMERIMDLAVKYGLKVTEDATESVGSYYREGKYAGRKTGSVGDIGCYSFNGNKIITTGGGGMIVTNNPEYAQKADYLTNQAKDDTVRYVHNETGYNYRMNNIQAAIGCAQLEKIEEYIDTKRKNFNIYKDALADIDGLELVEEPSYGFSNFWYYSLLVDKEKYGLNREELMKKLDESGIQTRPLWQLNHRQMPYKDCQAYSIEKAEHYYDRLLNIPCSVGLKPEDIKRVLGVMKDV